MQSVSKAYSLLLAGHVLMAMLVLVARRMVLVIMMLVVLLLSRHRSVTVAMLIQVAWGVTFVVVVRAGFLGWLLGAHVLVSK